MAFLERKSVVSYRCSCGRLRPFPRLYFCRYCFELRCEICVCHEIDARHCPTCLENLPVTDAWMKGNKCSNCLQCPLCQCNLTTRLAPAKVKVQPGEDPKTAQPVKNYYLCCLFCHWTNRVIGLPDLTTSSNVWPELENPNANVINELVEYYKTVSINDRMLRERKSHGTRRAYPHISGLSVALVRQRAGLPVTSRMPYRSQTSLQDTLKDMKVPRAEATEPENDLPDDIYTTAPDLLKMTTLRQRFRLPETEPTDTKSVRYFRKNLIGKLSRRCRTCEHNLIKPEFLPTSTKFKIQLSAYFLVPEVRIKTVEPLRAGELSQLWLLIINPTQHPTKISFLTLEDESSNLKPETACVPLRELAVTPNSTILLPDISVPLPGRDDAAEFDDTAETPNFNDDPNIVAWRKANKVVIKFSVTPGSELATKSRVLIGLTLSHIYTNTVIQQGKKELNEVTHAFKLILDLGEIVGSQN